MSHTTSVIEGWTGPGRQDAVIEPLKPVDDGLHMKMGQRGMYEWWYFDAHFDNGYTLVVFFHASNPNPGLEGKTGIEIVLLRPDGVRLQKFIPHKKPDFYAARDKPEVWIGQNTLQVKKRDGELPIYEIDVQERGLGCHLTYQAKVNGWKPGTGLSHFGDLGFFGWVIPFARASVEGTITDGEETFHVQGIGYHDHNWLNFRFATIIEYWMWGRIYSENLTVSYACTQCNEKVTRHTVKVVMLAEGKKVVVSTGEFDFLKDDFLAWNGCYQPVKCSRSGVRGPVAAGSRPMDRVHPCAASCAASRALLAGWAFSRAAPSSCTRGTVHASGSHSSGVCGQDQAAIKGVKII